MARYENEGYCPCIWVPKMWDENTDPRLQGLWSIVSANIVCESKDKLGIDIDTTAVDEMFSADPIARILLTCMVKKNANADKILVRQLHSSTTEQSLRDINEAVVSSIDPEILAYPGSNFIIVLAEAEYGMDLWVWDLRICR